MLARIKKNVSYANVISSIALFVALGGGAYALSVPSNSVGGKSSGRSGKVRRSRATPSGLPRSRPKAITSSEVKDSS